MLAEAGQTEISHIYIYICVNNIYHNDNDNDDNNHDIKCIYVYVYIYISLSIYIYIERERERVSQTERSPTHGHTGVFEQNTPFRRAFALQHSSRNCYPAPDLVFLKVNFPRVLVSGGVFFHRPRYLWTKTPPLETARPELPGIAPARAPHAARLPRSVS